MGTIEFENVKLNKEKVKKVRDNKKTTGVPISTFIEKLIDVALPERDLINGDGGKLLTTGQSVYFFSDALPFEVKAISKRYAVCVRPLNRKNDAAMIKNRVEMAAYSSFLDAYKALKSSPVYTIVDFERQICSTNNLVFNSYDYFDEGDCLKTIIALLDGEIELSHRNKADLDIDWNRTNKASA